MSNQQGPHNSAHALPRLSSFEGLNTLYSGHEPYAVPERVVPVVRMNPKRTMREQKPLGPDAIWGQYNNYRSNGLAGSAMVHTVVLALILGGSMFGRHVVQVVQPQHETVALIAPSPDSYAMPVAKKVVAGGGGGGDHDPLPAPKGRLPKFAMQQITPPSIVLRNP